MNRKILFFLFSTLLLQIACTPDKAFDKAGWQEKDDTGIYPHRNSMLKDLTRHRLKGLSFRELVERVGQPEGFSETKTNTAYYNIVKEYGNGAEPVFVRNLVITFNADSIVTQYGIEEIKRD